jgi:hypothetical protein
MAMPGKVAGHRPDVEQAGLVGQFLRSVVLWRQRDRMHQNAEHRPLKWKTVGSDRIWGVIPAPTMTPVRGPASIDAVGIDCLPALRIAVARSTVNDTQ